MKDKNAILFLSIAAGLITVLMIVSSVRNGGEQEEVLNNEVEESKEQVSIPATKPSYASALVTYKDKRVQLDTDCRATPTNLTFKNNTKIMVDNRSAKTRTVKVGVNYTIKPWDFALVTLSSSTLPATWYVDCDKSQNVATLLIQK